MKRDQDQRYQIDATSLAEGDADCKDYELIVMMATKPFNRGSSVNKCFSLLLPPSLFLGGRPDPHWPRSICLYLPQLFALDRCSCET